MSQTVIARRPAEAERTGAEVILQMTGIAKNFGPVQALRQVDLTVRRGEIHAVCGSKRGSHLALSLERLEDLSEHPLQSIGLSATQKPIERVGQFLVGPTRTCTLIDEVHRRHLVLSVELPPSPLAVPYTLPRPHQTVLHPVSRLLF